MHIYVDHSSMFIYEFRKHVTLCVFKKGGDICVFEPIKSDDVVLKVSILGCTDAAPEPSHPRLTRRDAATWEGRR